jgi:hypothetical protein
VAFAEWLGGGLLGLGRRAILQHSLQVSSKTLQVGDYFISFADLCVVYGGFAILALFSRSFWRSLRWDIYIY